MRLSKIGGKSLTLYKGFTAQSGSISVIEAGPKGRRVPGFLSTLYIGRVYSEPGLTGDPDQPSCIIEVTIDPESVEDRTEEYVKWSKTEGHESIDVSEYGYPAEWRNGAIWTIRADSSAHSGVSCYGDCDFVFCGVEVPYRLYRVYQNQDEWAADKAIVSK